MTPEEMRRRKEELGFSNALLAELSHVPIGTVNRILCGITRKPRYHTMIALEQALNEAAHYYYDTAKKQISYAREPQGSYGAAGRQLPNLVHQQILGYLYCVINDFCRDKQIDCQVYPGPVCLRLTEEKAQVIQADLVVIRDRQALQEWGIRGCPDLVMEVVSPDTVAEDYVHKTKLYMENGAGEYWILDPDRRQVFRYDFSTGGAPLIHKMEGRLGISTFGESLEIDLGRIALLAEGKPMRSEPVIG